MALAVPHRVPYFDRLEPLRNFVLEIGVITTEQGRARGSVETSHLRG